MDPEHFRVHIALASSMSKEEFLGVHQGPDKIDSRLAAFRALTEFRV
jgi:hypothetical protein